jgi:hypothetical protein
LGARTLIDSLLDAWRRASSTQWAPDDVLRPLVVLLIVLWCGPEVFAVIELTTLLELLGATLFLLAFTASFKMLALSVLDWLRRALLPSEYTALIKTRWPGTVAVGLGLIAVNAIVWFVLCFTPYVILFKVLGSA